MAPRALALALAFAALLFSGSADGSDEGKYDSRSRRDPFVPLAGVAETGTKGNIQEVRTIDDVILQGVVGGSKGARSVIMNGEILKEGDTAGRVSVLSVGRDSVRIKIDEEEHEVRLYE
ncbi:MAG: hypothetical protein ABIH74_05710 [Candidatus Omnitrophota bacterium]